MPLTGSNTNIPNEYNDKNMIVNTTVQSAKNTNDDIDVDKNLINQSTMASTASSWENNNSLYQINNGSDNYLQGTLLQHQADYLPLQPQGYYNYGNYHPSLLTPLDPFGSLLNQYGGGYNPLANSTRALGLRPPPEGYTAPANSTQRYSVTSSSSATSGQDNNKRPPTKKSKTTKTKITTHRKNKRNAQSRKRAADLKEKIDSIKAASNEEKTTDEKLIVKEVQLKSEKKNKQTAAERAKGKKAEIERNNKIPQNKRTAEEAKSLATATSTKKRKNECAKLRGEKKSGLKKKKKTSNSNDAGTIGKAKNGKPKKDAEYYSSTSLHQSPGTFMQTMSAVAPRWHDLLKVCERSVTEEEEEEQKTVGQMEGV